MDMNKVALENQVDILTHRLSHAEDQIRQLIDITNTLRNELSSQQRVINQFSLITAERKQSSSRNIMKSNLLNGSQSSINVPGGKSSSATSIQLDNWDFKDDMDIDWDAFDSLDVGALLPMPNSAIAAPSVQPPVPKPVPAIPTLPITIVVPQQNRAGNVVSLKHSRDEGSESEYPHEIKAMRYDSLDRILAYTVKASAISDKNILKVDASVNYDEERKTISAKIFRYMNVGDMNALSKLVSENFCDSLVMYFCQISETIYGKSEAMMLFSLLYESYPDGVWKQSNSEVHGKVVTIYYVFTGTSVFDMPLAVSFHQVKDHERGHKFSENSEEMAGNQIVRNVAEFNPNSRSGENGMSPILHLSGHNGSFSMQPLSTGVGNGLTRSRSGTGQRRSLGNGLQEIDLNSFSVLDNNNNNRTSGSTPRGSSEQDVASAIYALHTTSNDAALPIPALSDSDETDIIKIPRSKGNESFRLEMSRTGTLQPAANSSKVTRTPSLNSELMANALIKKSEHDRRKIDITFNDYNLIVQIVITSCPK